ncbi:MAG: hypothetical protein J7M26_04015 [Armatimonadetes bacterium]|nr:hypothetical protein [Armatimonadota bacterium]
MITSHTDSTAQAKASLTPGLVLAACALVFLAQCYWHRGFTVDDAYISFRYARNLAEGQGLVFNPGERVEGYTNFLWVLLIAASMKLHLASPELVAKVLGTLAGLGLVLLGPAAVAAMTKLRGRACLLGALALAAWPPLAYWSVSGLATSLFAFLLTAGLVVWLKAQSRAHGAAAGALLAVATLTRPEAPLFWAGGLAVRLLREGRRAKGQLIAFALTYLTPLVPWVLWKLAYYGQVLPNTFYIKRRGGLWPPVRPGGVMYVHDFLAAHWGLVFWALLPLLAYPALYLARRAWEFILPLLLYLVWIAKVGDWMPQYRFFVPVAALWAAMAGGALMTLWQKAHAELASQQRRRWGRGAVAGLVFVALLHVAVFSYFHRGRGGAPVAVAEKARRLVRPGELIAVHDAGIIPYLTRARTIDMIGLVWPQVLQCPVQWLDFPRTYQGKHRLPVRAGVVDLVLQQRPVLISTHIGRSEGELVASHPLDQLFLQKEAFRRDYVFVGDGLFLRRDRAREKGLLGDEGSPAAARPGREKAEQ